MDTGSKDNSEVINSLKKLKAGVFWAKLQSFPWWPARFASPPEIEELNELTSESSKTKQYAVMFLGTAKMKGWVNSNAIVPFTVDTLTDNNSQYFKEKKFNLPGQKDFRFAVRESMRICEYANNTKTRIKI